MDMVAAPLRAVGLISGTSMDGIDAAAVEIHEGPPLRADLRAFLTVPYPPAVRRALLDLIGSETRAPAPGESGARDVCRLHMVLGEAFAEAALVVLERAGWSPQGVSLIGSHGQTTVSAMTDERLAGYRAYSTLQLASPAVIAERTGTTVVSDFRSRDVASGGRGAPLVPLVDALLYARPGQARALLNLGGIANLTLLPSSGALDEVLGFDTGPANMPLDALVRLSSNGAESYDRDGAYASRGRVDEVVLRRLLEHPFLRQSPPKATGSEEFGRAFVSDLLARYPDVARDDLLATLARFAAEAAADGLRRWFPGGERPVDVLVSGGGTRNSALMGQLAACLAPVPLRPVEEEGGNSEAKEAVAFAVLGYLTLRGRAGNLPAATGARRAVPLGSITPGRLGLDVLSVDPRLSFP